jgi:hypothetical protein
MIESADEPNLALQLRNAAAAVSEVAQADALDRIEAIRPLVDSEIDSDDAPAPILLFTR